MVVKHNDYNLKALSEKWLRISFAATLSAFFLTLISWRTLEFTTLPPQHESITIQVQDIPQTEQERSIPAPARPAVPIVDESGDVPDDITILKTELNQSAFSLPVLDETEEVVEFVSYDQAPKVLKRVAPQYPEIARRAGVEGNVILSVGIDKKGNIVPDAITVLKNTTGNSGCVEAAIEAVKRFKFSPAYQRDKPVNVKIAIPFKFRLHK